jgi:hypothetical protein
MVCAVKLVWWAHCGIPSQTAHICAFIWTISTVFLAITCPCHRNTTPSTVTMEVCVWTHTCFWNENRQIIFGFFTVQNLKSLQTNVHNTLFSFCNISSSCGNAYKKGTHEDLTHCRVPWYDVKKVSLHSLHFMLKVNVLSLLRTSKIIHWWSCMLFHKKHSSSASKTV